MAVVNETTLMIMLKSFLYFCLIFNQIDISH
ncbi:hypothetical protein KCX20_01935 [Staphylococcus aureus]|nr:hypothetical protein [Staphylococcus aureus]MBS3561631.1 hypothetical protein [Staphylococcus aureus]HDP4294675.1 hypothetical protein [Staphylococcus aureus]